MKTYERCLEMNLAIHGNDKPHPAIASSLHNLGRLFRKLAKLDEALEKQKRSLKMELAIHGHDKPHPDIVVSVDSLGIV